MDVSVAFANLTGDWLARALGIVAILLGAANIAWRIAIENRRAVRRERGRQ